MWHGMPLKSIFNHGNTGKSIKYDYFSHILATSPQYAQIMADCVPCDISRVIIMGQPKTDPLNNGIESDEKTIFWAPTFGKAKYWNQTDVDIDSIVPLIPECEYKHFNDYLKQNNIHMIIKLHPMESCDDDFQLLLTNLRIYSHDSFSKNGYELYKCLSSASALITDYSSTYIDYLLLNRPIAFVINNIEEYSNSRGFIFENPLDYMPGKKIQDTQDLYDFINEISKDIDEFEEKRQRLNDIFNNYDVVDSNTKRLLDFMGIVK